MPTSRNHPGVMTAWKACRTHCKQAIHKTVMENIKKSHDDDDELEQISDHDQNDDSSALLILDEDEDANNNVDNDGRGDWIS